MEQLRPSTLTISERALRDNFRAVRAYLGGDVRYLAVVKADAYGHGARDVSRIALSEGAAGLAVALVEEGVALRDAGIDAPILVLGGVSADGAREAVRRRIAVALYDQGTLRALSDEARRSGVPALVHLKIDTGMGRVGVRGDAALDRLLGALKSSPAVLCEGVFTHFAAADDPGFTALQNERFARALARVRAEGFRPMAHAAASEALLRYPACRYDCVRPGVVLYGASVNVLCPGIRPAQRLTTRAVRLETIEAGETVGYGRTFTANRATVVATLPVGYGDGYPRALSGKASALVRGARVPLIGRVCMDMLMVDATEVPGVSENDEFVLLGDQGDQRITPDELAALSEKIPYEIMLGFSPRIPRRLGV